MLNGVGGLRVRWRPLVRSDKFIKGLEGREAKHIENAEEGGKF